MKENYNERKFSFANIYRNICKDTGRKNESSKLIVVIRLLILSMAVYSLVNCVLIAISAHISGFVFSIISMILFVVAFVCSYFWSSFTSYCALNVYVLIWTIANVVCFGWNIGVQHFIITLLVFCFFSKYRHEKAKFVYTAALLILRIYLYYYCQSNEPLFALAPELANILQMCRLLLFSCHWR